MTGLFRDLTEKEEHYFREWARDNYVPFNPISGVWHPVVQDECRRMNEEEGRSVTDPDLQTALLMSGFEEIEVEGLSGDGITVLRGTE